MATSKHNLSKKCGLILVLGATACGYEQKAVQTPSSPRLVSDANLQLAPNIDTTPSPSTDPNALVLGSKDDGKSFSISLGRTVVVKLEEAQDGGYQWGVAATALGEPRRDSVYLGGNDGSVGAPNLVTFSWRTAAASVGTYPLVFTMARLWDTSDATVFRVTITLAAQTD